jgi:hypothetical protein
MNTSKRIMIAAAFVLLAGLCASAAAQVEIGPIPMDTTVTMKLNAVEVSDGVVGLDPKFGETMFGYSFLGQTTEGLPGSFMFSMNCAPAVFTPGESNAISGGAWTLPVYMRPFRSLSNVYVGSLYGGIVDGTMGWAKDGTADIYMTFNVAGGTDTFGGATGKGTFQGTIKVDENGEKTVSGELTITYAFVTRK